MSRAHRKKILPWLIWLGVFYCAWLAIVISGNHWATIAENWGIAVAMAMGSYAAGATPMGGGTVGFPILVLLRRAPPLPDQRAGEA